MLTGALLAFLLNVCLLEKLLIPDPCYYHSHEGGRLFHWFYDLPATEGGHPVPTKLNMIITLLLGAIGGWLLARKRLKLST